MFKEVAIIIPFVYVFFHAELTVAEDLPEGTVQSGTLTNEKLMGDTMMGVATKVGTEGCNKPDSFLAYISRLPEGEPGFRSWGEKWIVYGCGNNYSVDIEFKEDGLDAANFSIR